MCHDVRCFLRIDDLDRTGQLNWLTEHLDNSLQSRVFEVQLHNDGCVEHIDIGDLNARWIGRACSSLANGICSRPAFQDFAHRRQGSHRLDDQHVTRHQSRIGLR